MRRRALVQLVLSALLLGMATYVAARPVPVLAVCARGCSNTVIVSMSVSAPTVAAGGSITVDVHLTNPVNDVVSAGICYALPNGTPAPGCQGPQIGPEALALFLVSGTARDGHWQGLVVIPHAAVSGAWTVQSLNTAAAVEGFKQFTGDPSFPGGTFTVVGASSDNTPPTIALSSISPLTVPLGNPVTIVAHITDDSGVAAASIQTLPSTAATIYVPLSLSSGTPLDGMWLVNLIPTALGIYNLTAIAAQDMAGNFGQIGGPPPFLGSFTVTAAIADQSITATGSNISAIEGHAFIGAVANFNDADPSSTSAEYAATVAWGDGSTLSGAISGPAGGPFTVSGSHAYAEERSYNVTVTITDNDKPSNTATASSTATVADAALAGHAVCPAVIQSNFAGATAAFTDANTGAHLDDFTALINWGDMRSSAGVITGTNPYTVSGRHIYATGGPHTITTTITDVGGSTIALTCRTTVSCDQEGDNEGQFQCSDQESGRHRHHGRRGLQLAE